MTTHRRRSNHDRTFSSWFATVSHFPRARCGNLENLPCESGTGEPQLGPKVLDLNAECVLKILRAQKLLAEVSVGGNLPLSIFHEGPYLLLIGARNVSHGPLDHINVGLRGESHPFEIFKHHGSYGFERGFFGFHVTLAASLLLDKRERVLASRDEAAEKGWELAASSQNHLGDAPIGGAPSTTLCLLEGRTLI